MLLLPHRWGVDERRGRRHTRRRDGRWVTAWDDRLGWGVAQFAHGGGCADHGNGGLGNVIGSTTLNGFGDDPLRLLVGFLVGDLVGDT